MRKHWLFGLSFAYFLFGLYFYDSAAQEARGPKMVLKEQAFDFKEVKEGAIISHSFKVFNHGDETLRILRVRPG